MNFKFILLESCLIVAPWWLDVLVSFFITVAGVYIAMWLQKYCEQKNDLKTAILCVNSIIEELKIIEENFNTNKIDFQEPNKNMIETPIWDGIIHAGMSQQLAKLDNFIKKKFKGQKIDSINVWYREVFDFYNCVKDFNQWGAMYTNTYLKFLINISKDKKQEIIDADNQIKTKLMTIINYCETLFDNVKIEREKLESQLNTICALLSKKKR